MDREKENAQNADILAVQPLQKADLSSAEDVLVVQALQEADLAAAEDAVEDVLVVQALQDIDLAVVEDALAPSGEDGEDLPDIFAALPDKPY